MLHLLPSPSFIFSVCYREKINLELLWKLLRAHSNVRSSSLLSIEELQTAESKRSDCWTLPEMRLLLAEARKKHLFFLMTCLLQSTSVISIKLWWNVNITKGGKDREKRKLSDSSKDIVQIASRANQWENKLLRFLYSFYQTIYFFLPAYTNKSIYASLCHVLYTKKKGWTHQNFPDTTTSV